jgi:hypothetical protein
MLSGGQSCKFTTLNGITGYFATDNAQVASEFEQHMREGRSGLTEVTDVEFVRDYLDKKKAGAVYAPPLRDELVNGRVRVSESEYKTRLAEAQSAVGVVSPLPAAPERPVATAVSVDPINREIARALPTKEDFKPLVGKRKPMVKPPAPAP